MPLRTTVTERVASIHQIHREQIPALDGVRGFAVILVLLHHLSAYMPNMWHGIRSVMVLGWIGVDLFFVLSGFLITGILLDTKQAPNYFSSFYARRLLRIFPLYYSVLLLVLGLAYLNGWFRGAVPLQSDWKFYFVYLNNWWPLLKDHWHANVIGHFWSLAVEEQFYLMWPVCLWLIPKRTVLPVALTGVAAALALRVLLFSNYGPIRDVVENTFCRMDELLLGAVAAYLVRSPAIWVTAKPYIQFGAVLAIFGMAAALIGGEKTIWSLGISCLGVAFFGLVLRIFETRHSGGALQRLLKIKLLRAFGKYSYGIYVFHVPVFYVWWAIVLSSFGDEISTPVVVAFSAAAITTTFCLAAVSYRQFESRFLRLKNRFEPRDSSVP
jgi:peptidoglycan/LPS O-acetylase OafA/YrhL